jgi:ABC-type uncharacterized transport system permease subunit
VIRLSVFACYLVASWMLASARLADADAHSPLRPAVPALLVGGFGLVLHLVLLTHLIFADEGLQLSIANVISLTGWQVAAIALVAAFWAHLRGLAAVLFPVAALGALGSGLGPVGESLGGLGWEMRAHILISVAAYTLLTVGAAIAILIAIQDRALRRHRIGAWTRMLPPLETMEQVLFGTIHAGVILLTLSVFSGLIFVENVLAQHLAHKTILTVAALVVFALLLLGRWRFGWRGRRAIYWTLAGYAVLVLGYFGSRVILEVLLERQWG